MTVPITRPAEAASETPSSLQFVLTFWRAFPGRSALMVALLVLSGLAEGVGLVAILPLLRGVLSEQPDEDDAFSQALGMVGLEPSLALVLTFITIMMALKAGLLWLAMREVGYTAAHVATTLRRRLIRALTFAKWQHVSSQPSGFLTSAISAQTNRAAMAYSDACSSLADLIQTLIYFGVVFFISPTAAILAFVVGVATFALFGPLIRSTRDAGAAQTRTMKSLVARLTEILAGVKPIKAMGREDDVWPMLERETMAFEGAQRKVILARGSIMSLYEPIAVAVVSVGLYFALTYDFLPLTELVVIALVFYRTMIKASGVQRRYQSFVANESAFWDVSAQIDLAENAREHALKGEGEPQLAREIRLEDIHVAFGSKVVLDGVDATIPARALTAVTGPSGAGKTTLVDVVLGLLVPDRGKVLIDGVPLSTLPTAQWRRGVGYVPQEVLLFHDTIRANVTLSRPGVSDDEVVRALKAAGAWTFVAEREGGLDHIVGERGGHLSGGQRQRIAIARALLARPQILIMDEATAALDPATEAEIIETLLALKSEVTIIAISHQPAMAEAADLVLALQNGRAVDRSVGAEIGLS